MNVKQLKEALDEYDDEMEVIIDMHSDYKLIDGFNEIKGVNQGGYIMTSHRTMALENKKREKTYLEIF